MKQSGQCPKCNSKEILRVKGWVGGYGSGNYAVVGKRGFLSTTTAKIARYVCTHCGFVEEWVDEEVELEKVRQQYNENTSPT